MHEADTSALQSTAVDQAAIAAPLSDAQRRELDAADVREQRFAFAPKLAAFNAAGLGLCALLSLLSAIVDVSGLLFALVLAGLAYAETQGRKRVLNYQPAGLRALSINQVVLVTLVTLYAASRIYIALSSPSPIAQLLETNAELASALDATGTAEATHDMDSMVRYGVIGFYSLLILATLIFQGGSALYYASRTKHLQAFLSQTPAWIIDLKRTRTR